MQPLKHFLAAAILLGSLTTLACNEDGGALTFRSGGLDFLTIDPTAATIKVGEAIDLVGTINEASSGRKTPCYDPSPAAAWRSSRPEVAGVLPTNVAQCRARVTGVSVGETIVSVGLNPVGSVVIRVVEAPPVVASIRVFPSGTIDMIPGERRDVVCTAFDAAGMAIPGVAMDWSIDRTAVATVAQTGEVSAVAPGQAIATCRAKGTTVEAKATIIVHGPTVTLDPAQATVAPQQTVSLTGRVRDFRGNDISVSSADLKWESRDADAVSIAGGGSAGLIGTARGLIGGRSSEISLTHLPSGAKGTAMVTVSQPAPAPSALLICSSTYVSLLGSAVCSLFGLDGTAATNATFSVVSGPATFTGALLRANTGAAADQDVVLSATGTLNGQAATGALTLKTGNAQTATSAAIDFVGGAPAAVRVGQKYRMACTASGASGPLTNIGPVFSVQSTGTGTLPFLLDSYGWLSAQAVGTATAQCFVNGVPGRKDVTVTP